MVKKIGVTLMFLTILAGPLIDSSFAMAQTNTIAGKIINLGRFNLDQKMEQLLIKNGFVITPGEGENDISDVYIACRDHNDPIFVTTDAILHVSHILFDYHLRIAEIYRFVIEVEDLTDAMLKSTFVQYQSAQDQSIKEAARRNLAFFAVAKKLLYPEYKVPEIVSLLVNKELALISAHKEIALSPIMGASPFRGAGTSPGEDYSQYVPRGHYTRNETFKRFFKAMTWYGRMAFGLPDEFSPGKRPTLQALLIIKSLNEENGKWMEVWENVYEPIAFFVGRADDLDIYDYRALADQIYGKDISSDNIGDPEKLDSFIAKAKAIKKTKISECYVKGMRFMGQRFIPDSYIFDRLTGYPWRSFPKSLDVMAILGSEKAKTLLKQQADFDIEQYKKNFADLEQEFGTLCHIAEDWVDWKKNLYWRWLYCLKPLFEKKGAKYPKFMQNDAWLSKELSTACASWAELRHDTILYAKPSYVLKGVPFFQLTKGYVEPYPEVYKRIASLAKEIREGLRSRGLLFAECRDKLIDFEELLGSLEHISRKELSHQEITKDEYHAIRQIGNILKNITGFSKEVQERVASATDNKMAVISDVHTDTGSNRVLQVGVGDPYYIYVATESDGAYKVTKGAVFSYFEFQWPMEDRLTDEKWQKMLEQHKEPPLPDWTSDFMAD